ncbi:unnamed protein product [Urochloa humidicola]
MVLEVDPNAEPSIKGRSPLMLKMLGPNRIIATKGDLKKSYDCDNEAVDYAMKATAEVEQKVLLAHAATPPSAEPDMPSKKSSKDKAKPADMVVTKEVDLLTGDPSKTAVIGTSLPSK